MFNHHKKKIENEYLTIRKKSHYNQLREKKKHNKSLRSVLIDEHDAYTALKKKSFKN